MLLVSLISIPKQTTMRNKIVLTVLSTIFTFAALAQKNVDKGNGRWKSMNSEQKSNSSANWMKKKLGLSEEQRTKVYNSNLQFYNTVKAARDSFKVNKNKEARKAAVKAAGEKREAELKTILTTEQYEALKKARAERKEKKGKGSKTKGKSKGPKKGESTGDDNQDEEIEDSDELDTP